MYSSSNTIPTINTMNMYAPTKISNIWILIKNLLNLAAPSAILIIININQVITVGIPIINLKNMLLS